jgi:hypothetical protein
MADHLLMLPAGSAEQPRCNHVQHFVQNIKCWKSAGLLPVVACSNALLELLSLVDIMLLPEA